MKKIQKKLFLDEKLTSNDQEIGEKPYVWCQNGDMNFGYRKGCKC